MQFQAKLLKNAYGFDVSGVVQDATQDNVRDKTSPVRSPDKEDFVPQNMVTDQLSEEEQREVSTARALLNPHAGNLPNRKYGQ